jgi:hypothetical protein
MSTELENLFNKMFLMLTEEFVSYNPNHNLLYFIEYTTLHQQIIFNSAVQLVQIQYYQMATEEETTSNDRRSHQQSENREEPLSPK